MIRASEIEQRQKENYEREKNRIIAQIVDEFDRELIANYDSIESKTFIAWPKWLSPAFSQAMKEALCIYETNGWQTGIVRGYDPISQVSRTSISFVNPFRKDPRVTPPEDPPAPSSPSE
jgi:hypothetical protein